MRWALKYRAIPVTVKYLLNPILSTKIPKGRPMTDVSRQVIMIFLPAENCEKQNRTCSNLLTLSKNGIYWAIENIHMQTNSQNVPDNCFKSWHFMAQGSVSELNYDKLSSLILLYLSALSALLSIYTAMQQQIKLMKHIPTEAQRGGPKLLVY